MKRLAFALALTLIMAASAAAQIRLDDNEDQRPIVHNVGTLEGVEVSQGIIPEGSIVRTGATYTAEVSGSLAGHLTVVFDYNAPELDQKTGNQIVSGTWTLAVYKEGAYQGTLFGELTSGTITSRGRKAVGFSVIGAELTIKGGTKEMAYVSSSVAFGRLNMVREHNLKFDDAAVPTVSGTLELAF